MVADEIWSLKAWSESFSQSNISAGFDDRKEFWNFGWDWYIYKQRSEKGLLVLLQELHCGIGEECMGQSFSGCGLDEIPLQTVKREEKKRPSMTQIHLNSLKIYYTGCWFNPWMLYSACRSILGKIPNHKVALQCFHQRVNLRQKAFRCRKNMVEWGVLYTAL